MKNKLLKTLAISGLVLGAGFGLVGCGPADKEPTNSTDSQIRAVYALAQENGETRTYEEWLASIKGEKGATGNGISGVTIIDSSENVDTYRISFTDGTHYDFTITNGTNGQNGANADLWTIGDDGFWYKNGTKTENKAIGEDGDDADVYTIGSDGYWYKNNQKTEYKAIGEDLTQKQYTVTYNFNLQVSPLANLLKNEIHNKSVFNKVGYELSDESNFDDDFIVKYNQVTTSGSYFDLYSFEDLGLQEYFEGWYYKDVKIEHINVVADDIELTAKWKENVLNLVALEEETVLDFVYNDDSLTATAYPTQSNSGYANGSIAVGIPELVLHNGKFYTVTDFVRRYEDACNYKVLYLPKTIENSSIDYWLTTQIFNNNYFGDIYYQPNNSTNIDGHYIGYVGDYVFVSHPSYGKNFNLIYRVDWDTCEAKLFTCSGLFNILNNQTISIEDFKVVKDGKTFNFKVTEMSRCWFNTNHIWIQNADFYNDWSGNYNDIDINIIMPENLKYFEALGQGAFVGTELFEHTEFVVYNINVYYNNYFDDLELSSSYTSPYASIKSLNIYIYRAKEPSEQEKQTGNYWHYVDDVPTIWTVED